MSENPIWYRPNQALELLPVGKTKLAEMIRTGQVESVLVGRTRLIRASSIHSLRTDEAA